MFLDLNTMMVFRNKSTPLHVNARISESLIPVFNAKITNSFSLGEHASSNLSSSSSVSHRSLLLFSSSKETFDAGFSLTYSHSFRARLFRITQVHIPLIATNSTIEYYELKLSITAKMDSYPPSFSSRRGCSPCSLLYTVFFYRANFFRDDTLIQISRLTLGSPHERSCQENRPDPQQFSIQKFF